MGISEILKEYQSLPKGYISRKIIKGKEYFYLQWIENGKIKSKYIPRNELETLEGKIARRNELEAILSDFYDSLPTHHRTISNRERSLTGSLMSDDVVIATFKNGEMIYCDYQLAPNVIKRNGNIDAFLRSRCIDLSRPNSRVLLKMLGITDKNELLITLFSHGACITDNYWFKPSGSKLKYTDVCFTNDLYSELALNGVIPQIRSFGSPSPELTNIGSYEKAWKLINGEWWLYKKGNDDEIFSELFAYYLSILLNVPTAIYEYIDGNIRTKNFATRFNFEPMSSFMGSNENYSDVFDVLVDISKDIAMQYIKLIWVDTIVYNVDRHNQNYGLLRNKETGRYTSLAPNFDNNMALISFNKTLDLNTSKDKMIELFVNLLNERELANKIYQEIKTTKLDYKELKKVFGMIPIKRDEDKILRFIIARYEYLVNL